MGLLETSGIDLKDVDLDDIDPSLFAPIEGLDSKQLTVKQIGTEGVDDMIVLDDLDENMILANLRTRYQRNIIYTYIGSILVAVNSFKELKGLYEDTAFFHKKSLTQCPPHIYALSEKAYSSLIATGLNQAFIISGESGAGKTESMKFICRYMANLKSELNNIQTNVLNVNVVLEAFGNAKTVYNNNSSRFGKFTELQFDEVGTLCGARVRQYLLEKSRVVRQAQNERNYHVFYYVAAGAAETDRGRWGLGGKTPESFNYLKHSGCTSVPNINDRAEYTNLRNAMTMFTSQETDFISSTVAAILHLGNIMFVNDPEKDIVVDIANKPVLEIVAGLLGISPDHLSGPLVKRSNVIRGERIFSPLSEVQAKDSRDALSKALYGHIFTFIINKVNEVICRPGTHKFIGVLDIFGFENFQKNSLEQFCINLANEQLQDFFNEHIFKLEQLEYKHEGVKLTEVHFTDNKACLDMIMDVPNGLLDILDEQSYFPKATVDSLLNRFDENYKGHPNYERDLKIKEAYVVRHYAERVSYLSNDFLDKNRDIISSDLLEAFAASTVPLLHRVLGFTKGAVDSVEKPGSRAKAETVKRKIPTVCYQFKTSLDELMVTLRKTQPYFIRCIKPNQQQVPNNLVDQFVLKQLQYSGMLETVRIRRQGYPVRFAFQDFIERFQYLLPPAERKHLSQKGKGGCSDLIKLVGLQTGDYVFGKSKLFLKDKPASFLETRLAQIQAERMHKLMQEIERKKKEEQERLEAERKRKEEEERRLAEEKRRQEEERKAREAERLVIEAEERAKREHEKALKRQGEERREEEEQRMRVVVARPGDLTLPSQVKEHHHQGDKREGDDGEGDHDDDGDIEVTDSEDESTAAEKSLAPPPPIPADYLSKEEVVRKMVQNPGWMEERKLKKMLQAYQDLDAYNLKVEAIREAKKAEEDAFMKLPPWKRELVKKQKEEERQARRVKRKEEKLAAKKSGAKKDKGSRRARRTSVTPSLMSTHSAAPSSSTAGTLSTPTSFTAPPAVKPRPLSAAPSLTPSALSTLTATSSASSSRTTSPSNTPDQAILPGRAVSVNVRRSNRTESQFYTDDFKVEAPPEIPPDTLPRNEIERRLAAKPDWKEEKELKKQLGYYKEHDKWESKNSALLAQQQEEVAKFNALPAWKREQLQKKGGAPPNRSLSPAAGPGQGGNQLRSPSPLGKSVSLAADLVVPGQAASPAPTSPKSPSQQQQQEQQHPGQPEPPALAPQQQQLQQGGPGEGQFYYQYYTPGPQGPPGQQPYYYDPYNPYNAYPYQYYYDPNQPPPAQPPPPPAQAHQPSQGDPYNSNYSYYYGQQPNYGGDPNYYGYGAPGQPQQQQQPSQGQQEAPPQQQQQESQEAKKDQRSGQVSPTPSVKKAPEGTAPSSSTSPSPSSPLTPTFTSSPVAEVVAGSKRQRSPSSASSTARATGSVAQAATGGDVPAWKQALIEKKRKEMQEKQLTAEREEQAKLDAIPKWKKALAEREKS